LGHVNQLMPVVCVILDNLTAGRMVCRGPNEQIGLVGDSQLEIIFDTVKSSRKFLNLVSRPNCSFVVGWGGEATVQYEGIARQPKGVALGQFQKVYFANWPECRSHLSWPGIVYFVVRPTWVRYSDYDRDPPYIAEVDFLRRR